MKKKVYVSIIFLWLIIQSCILPGYQKTNTKFEYAGILADTSKSYVYKTNIKLYDNDFSGLIIIKPGNKSRRAVFINEIGMKFFDMEIFSDSFKINHIFTPLNKKMLIKLLVSDFRFIFTQNLNGKNKYFKNKKTRNIALKPASIKEIYDFDKKTSLPLSAFKYSLFGKKTFLKYGNYSENIPQIIELKHKKIKFEIKMKFIK